MVLGQADNEKELDSQTESNDGADHAKTSTGTGYQRAEDWDAEVKARQKRGEYTWEERVQFEGQKYGNRVNQNEILKKNLKAF